LKIPAETARVCTVSANRLPPSPIASM